MFSKKSDKKEEKEKRKAHSTVVRELSSRLLSSPAATSPQNLKQNPLTRSRSFEDLKNSVSADAVLTPSQKAELSAETPSHSRLTRSGSLDDNRLQEQKQNKFRCRLEDFPIIRGSTWAYLSLYETHQKKLEPMKKRILAAAEFKIFDALREKFIFIELKYKLCCQVQNLLNTFISPAYEEIEKRGRIVDLTSSTQNPGITLSNSTALSTSLSLFGGTEPSVELEGIRKHFHEAIATAIDSGIIGTPLLQEGIQERIFYSEKTLTKIRQADEASQNNKIQIITNGFHYDHLPHSIQQHLLNNNIKDNYDAAFNEFKQTVEEVDQELRELKAIAFKLSDTKSSSQKVVEQLPKIYSSSNEVTDIWKDVVREKAPGFYEAEEHEDLTFLNYIGIAIKDAILKKGAPSETIVYIKNDENDIELLCTDIFLKLAIHNAEKYKPANGHPDLEALKKLVSKKDRQIPKYLKTAFKNLKEFVNKEDNQIPRSVQIIIDECVSSFVNKEITPSKPNIGNQQDPVSPSPL